VDEDAAYDQLDAEEEATRKAPEEARRAAADAETKLARIKALLAERNGQRPSTASAAPPAGFGATPTSGAASRTVLPVHVGGQQR
jgi:hypothetical protein